ncbi:hypothetical protein Sjap_022921 [Stephania japonica]|uniref:Uncharacterized protein n=1 Tax=Stephania japonica TaxID=461633 RepID=A0AAP0HTI6_9MAGN
MGKGPKGVARSSVAGEGGDSPAVAILCAKKEGATLARREGEWNATLPKHPSPQPAWRGDLSSPTDTRRSSPASGRAGTLGVVPGEGGGGGAKAPPLPSCKGAGKTALALCRG